MSEEKRRGRPKELNARDKRVDIRLTSDELSRIEKLREKYGTTTNVIMKGIELLENLDA